MELKKRLSTIFIRYISMFCVATPLLIVLLIASFVTLLSNGIILPANYSETQLSERKSEIAGSKTVTPDLIPQTCRYAVFTPQGKILSGNLNSADAAQAWKVTQIKGNRQHFIYFYLSIPRKNEICIVRYTLMTQFGSPLLRRYLPPPEILFFCLFGVGFLLEVFLLASSFGKMLRQKMSSLQNAAEKIRNQDLNFSVGFSGVLEIDNVLHSIDKMKEALKASLKKQWDSEQIRREQMSALAHDIKTPITIVRGNVDLLSETNLTEEQKEYTAYIEKSVRQMEQYIKTLIEISKTEMGYSLCKEPLDSRIFVDDIHSQITTLTAAKKLTLHFETNSLPQSFCADSDLLQRAILNIVSNAVEFSSENGEIIFDMAGEQNLIRFCVIDYGKGFSSNDLKQATQQFYMGDKSRSSKTHYGMGLFIAKSIAEQHGGTLSIANSSVSGGGQVTIEIPGFPQPPGKVSFVSGSGTIR